ncbi:GNAT family N-acetyltransferase [uncultured Friedmanniella sp.]|uniref:GNAT family N-acetyltransferase n=1 Tax=uncultured Friedmanniella sp. TaxID=335381 RepID=UPI0035CBF89E
MTSPDGAAASVAHLTAARHDDLPAILALEREGFPAEEQWSERSWAGELVGSGRTVLLARSGGVVGVISLFTTGELADLHRLVVAPAERGRGVGLALVRAGLEAVGHLGALAVMLEVGYRNEPAIALYQRVGFEQLRARPDYYGPGEHALILKLYDLPGWPERYAAAERELARWETEGP